MLARLCDSFSKLWTSFTISVQAFRFMVGPSHCPMISKYGPSLSKEVGPVEPSFLVVKKSYFNEKIYCESIELHKTDSTCRKSIQ